MRSTMKPGAVGGTTVSGSRRATLAGGAALAVTAKLGTVATNVVGDVHTIRMTDGTVAQASYSTDNWVHETKATVDAAAPAGSFYFEFFLSSSTISKSASITSPSALPPAFGGGGGWPPPAAPAPGGACLACA